MAVNKTEKDDDVLSKISRLEKLKKLKQDAIRSNNQERQEDIKKQREKSYEWKLSTSTNVEEIDESATVVEKQNKKENWEYTLEECTKWDKRQKNRLCNNTDEYQNVVKLAELSYKKELDNLGIDKDAYSKQKRKTEVISKEAEMSQTKIAPAQMDKEALQRLAERIRYDGTKKFKKRKNNEGGLDGEYINHKNKQFNLKLEREYKN